MAGTRVLPLRGSLTVAFAAVLVVGILAGSALSSDVSCADSLTTLLPCAPAVQNNYTAPSEDCCTAVKSVSPSCVCYLLSNKTPIPDAFKDIDLEGVAKIPKACGLKALYA